MINFDSGEALLHSKFETKGDSRVSLRLDIQLYCFKSVKTCLYEPRSALYHLFMKLQLKPYN